MDWWPCYNDFIKYFANFIFFFSQSFIEKKEGNYMFKYTCASHALIKTKISTNEEVSGFKSLRCCIYHADKC